MMWAGDDRHHTRQGPPILTQLEGECPRVNLRVAEEMYGKIADFAAVNGWTFTRAARLILAAGLNSTRELRNQEAAA